MNGSVTRTLPLSSWGVSNRGAVSACSEMAASTCWRSIPSLMSGLFAIDFCVACVVWHALEQLVIPPRMSSHKFVIARHEKSSNYFLPESVSPV